MVCRSGGISIGICAHLRLGEENTGFVSSWFGRASNSRIASPVNELLFKVFDTFRLLEMSTQEFNPSFVN